MIESSVAQAAAESHPIQVNEQPKTKEEAMANLHAFSHEGRFEQGTTGAHGTRLISQMPRIKRCYGWLKLSGDVLCSLDRKMRAPPISLHKITRMISLDKEYIAIVYEYVEEGRNDPAVVKGVLEFLWHAGFEATLGGGARNWKSGVLVDLSDIVHAGGYGWLPKIYGETIAERVLLEWPASWHLVGTEPNTINVSNPSRYN